MSRIQKALGKLRSGDDGGAVKSPSDGLSESGAREAHPRVRRTSLERPRRRYIADDVVIDEPPTSFNVPIDVEYLQDQGLLPYEKDLDLIAQQFRRIKRPVLNTAFDIAGAGEEQANVIMVASALPRSGKTFCSVNLAVSVAKERDVGAVLVDADVLKPNISAVFGLEDRVGLIDYLLDSSVTLDEVLVGTDMHDIVVVPAGAQHEEATELLASKRMKQFIHELSQRYYARGIIVDTPPLLLTNEAHVLAENMGQIVMVVEAGETSQESTVQALESLNRSKPINAILNKARNGSFGGYTASEYGYYSAPGGGRRYAKNEEQE